MVVLANRRILSPLRLPVSPFGHAGLSLVQLRHKLKGQAERRFSVFPSPSFDLGDIAINHLLHNFQRQRAVDQHFLVKLANIKLST